jgi:hypothetical protein
MTEILSSSPSYVLSLVEGITQDGLDIHDLVISACWQSRLDMEALLTSCCLYE